MEDHVVKQMRTVRREIGELIEYWIEQYHQTVFKYDIKYKHMKTAVVRAKREKISMNSGIIKAKETVIE